MPRARRAGDLDKLRGVAAGVVADVGVELARLAAERRLDLRRA